MSCTVYSSASVFGIAGNWIPAAYAAVQKEVRLKNYSEDPNRQYHIQVAPGEVGRYVMLPGDPGRCEEIASLLDDAVLVAYNREFKTYTGYLDGEQVSVCSTGVGGPSASIAVQELYNCGADTFIRVGTCGGMQLDVKSGDVVIGTSAVRAEGTSKEIAPIEYPAAADFDVTAALIGAAEKSGYETHYGTVQCKDAFYGQHEPEKMAVASELLAKWDAWKKMGCLASEMESAVIYILCSLLRCRAGGCYSVVANQEREALGIENPVVHNTFYASEIAVEAIRTLIEQDRNVALDRIMGELQPKAVICDFDGTIAFTEKVSYEAFRKTAAKYGANDIDEERWKMLVGHTDAENWDAVRTWYPDAILPDTDSLIDESRMDFLMMSSGLEPNKWFVHHVSRRLDVPYHIVTNNKADIVDAVMGDLGFGGYYEMWDNVLSCADEKISKEEAWKHASGDAEPSKVLVFEDNPDAIRLALSLGYNVVAVEHEYNANEVRNIEGVALVTR